MYISDVYTNIKEKEQEQGRSGINELEALEEAKKKDEAISCFKKDNNNKKDVATPGTKVAKISIDHYERIGNL